MADRWILTECAEADLSVVIRGTQAHAVRRYTGFILARNGETFEGAEEIEAKSLAKAKEVSERDGKPLKYKRLIWHIPIYEGDVLKRGGKYRGTVVERPSGWCMEIRERTVRKKTEHGGSTKVTLPLPRGQVIYQELRGLLNRLTGASVRMVEPPKGKKGKVAA